MTSHIFYLVLLCVCLHSSSASEGKKNECLAHECLCVSAGGNTCGYSTGETCDPDECYARDECPGYGYWCEDAAIEKCHCEFENMGADHNGIMCKTTDGSSYLFGSCDTGAVCSGNETDDYVNRKSKLCEGPIVKDREDCKDGWPTCGTGLLTKDKCQEGHGGRGQMEMYCKKFCGFC